MISSNLQDINDQIHTAAKRAGRDTDTITLVAVSKYQPLERIQQAITCGQACFGENYLQEAQEKISQCPQDIRWHFIGHLQSNKAKDAAGLFDVIETLDRLKVARRLEHEAARLDRILNVLVQVNVGREPQKSGVMAEDLPSFLAALKDLPHLCVRGLMTMPPYAEDPERSRPFFRQLRVLTEQAAGHGLFHDNVNPALSMGMSADFPVAIEEGATIVRVGTALFGGRQAH
jgi:PLP dependent protein